MERDEFRRRIVLAWRFVNEDLAVDRTVSSLHPLSVNPEFNAVALDPVATYRDIYLKASSLSYYNFMLQDHAIFQFSWRNSDNWRLAYLPNPWLSGVISAGERLSEWEALQEMGDLDSEDVVRLVDELPFEAAIPSIRFEYSISQYKEMSHPVAHLHIGRHTENRWALARSLDPLTFTMLIVKQYYNNIWQDKSSFCGGRAEECVEFRLIGELRKASLIHKFTQNERSSLHFTSI